MVGSILSGKNCLLGPKERWFLFLEASRLLTHREGGGVGLYWAEISTGF
jgi:hypothetical protein